MIDRAAFEEQSIESLTGLSAGQLSGKEPFSVANAVQGISRRRKKTFADRASTAHDEADKALTQGDTEQMTDLNRDELKAHLENQNLKVDARLQSFEQTVKDAVGGVRHEMAEMRGELKVMHSEIGSLKNIKVSIWGAAGATILGVGGIMVAMLSYGVANFDSGRETSQLIEAAKQQTLDNKKLLDQIQAQQRNPATAPPPESSAK